MKKMIEEYLDEVLNILNHVFGIHSIVVCDKVNNNIDQSWMEIMREFVNLLDHFYRGYQRELVLFSNSFGDRYPIEECILIGL